jgi:hypothetical protein
MPIDPRILDGIRGIPQPQMQDPLENYTKALSIKHLIDQQRQQQQMAPLQLQAAQEQLKGAQMENQQRQQGLTDDKGAREFFASNPDPTAEEILAKLGPKVGIPIVKSRFEAEEARLKMGSQKSTQLGQIAGSIKDEQSFHRGIGDALSRGLITREHAAQFLQMPWGPETQAQVQQIAQQAMTAEQQHDAELKDLEEARKRILFPLQQSKAESEAATGKAEAQTKGAVAFAMANPNDAEAQQLGMTPEQRAQLKLRAEEIAKLNSPAELAAKASDPNAPPETRDAAKAALKLLEQHALASRPVINNTIPGMATPTGQTQTTGDEFLKSIPPSVAAQVKAIADGRSSIPSASARSAIAQQIREAVFRYDPTFSEQRSQVRKAFTTGKDGANIGALNTAIVHLGRLGDTAEALKSGSFTPGNELFNYFKDKFGSPVVTNFELLKDAVAGEMASALKGSATDVEISNMKKSIRSSNSPEQMRGVIGEGMAILNDKANTFNERYHREMPDDPWSPILPSAKAQLDRHSKPAAAAASGKPAVSTPAGKIAVISPEGTPGFIDADKWDAAQKRGFRKP